MTQLDTSNDSFVASGGQGIVILNPRSDLSRPQALRLAAWLVAIADLDDEFPSLLEAVRST